MWMWKRRSTANRSRSGCPADDGERLAGRCAGQARAASAGRSTGCDKVAGALSALLLVLAAAAAFPAPAQGPLPGDAATAPVFSPAYDKTPPAMPDTEARKVRIGVLAYLGTEHAEREWTPVRQFLQKALPPHHVEFVYQTLTELPAAAASRAIDFVVTNPGQYVALELDAGASRIATVERDRHSVDGLGLGSAVVARADRDDLNRLRDLRGRTLAATTAEGFGGYQLVWRELAALDIDPVTDLKARSFVGFPMSRVLDAVARGQADAGVVRACVLESLPDWPTRYKVLSPQPHNGFGCQVSTRLYPDWPFATLPHTSPEVARAVAVALLQMPATPDGLRFTVPADYQSVHELFRELQIGPYAYLREHGLAAMARRYWPALALLGAVLALWLLYTFRVEKLVQARTRALRDALEEGKQIEARVRASQESIDHMSRLSILGELSTTLAHELSQPLAGISNYGRSLLRRLDSGRLDDDAVRLAASEITGQAQHAAGVLARIRAFARKRVSVRDIRRPADVVAEAVSLFCSMQPETPHIRIHDELPARTRIKVDSLQIQQVLLNLLKNALDAMREAPPETRAIDIALASRDTDVLVTVRDHGAGLTATQRARLFEPFYTDKAEGLGLGLSISYSIVEAHGGTLTANAPAQGRGMVFSLSLPIVRHDPAAPEQPPQ